MIATVPASIAAAGLAALGLLGGCHTSADGRLEAVVAEGVSDLSAPQEYEVRRRSLLETIARVRAARASSEGESARRLALQGFTAMLRGVESRIAFMKNDSGNIEAATRDARRGDRWLKAGARLLRSAGRELDVRVGTLMGY